MSTAWKCLSVAEFIDRCNWFDSALTSQQAIALNQKSLANWQRLTTQEFFQLQNWSGKAVTNLSTAMVVEEATLSMTAKNSLFWQCFNWSGEKKAPAPEKVESVLEEATEAIAAVEKFTLNDLSQLF